jgi:hypothetical protein
MGGAPDMVTATERSNTQFKIITELRIFFHEIR